MQANPREEALDAARDAFYTGEITRAIDTLHQGNRQPRPQTIWPATGADGKRLFSQPTRSILFIPHRHGPRDLSCSLYLNLLEAYPLAAMGHNSADYIHLLSSVIDLGMADREKYSETRTLWRCRRNSGPRNMPQYAVP